MEPCRPRRRRLLPGPACRPVRPRRRAGRRARSPAAAAAGLRPGRVRGARAAGAARAQWGAEGRVCRGERRCVAGVPAGRRRLREPRADGRAGGAGGGRAVCREAHGSELEYSMRGRPELERLGADALAGAAAVFVGSGHIRSVLEEVVGHVDRVHEVPPGVDVDEFVPEPRDAALRNLIAEAAADPENPGNADERQPDEGNAARLTQFLAADEPTVVYFGKLIENKGVHVLLEALRQVDARAVIVGFGDYRRELERLAPQRTLFTGPLEHRHLVHLLPLADVTVVPSIFPEAFGMVAAEAAAAGSLPLVARHSGLAEIAR